MSGFKAETMAHFQEELLKAVEQCVLKVRFSHCVLGTQAEEFKDIWIADEVAGLEGFRFLMGHGGELCLVFGKPASFVVEAGDLAAKFTDGPAASNAFDLIEATLGFVGELNDLCEVSEGQE